MPAARREAWEDCLVGAFVFLRLAVPTGRMMDATVNVFDEMCAHIPTNRLKDAVKRSMTLTDEGGQSIYWDGRAVALAYSRLLEEGAFSSDRVTDKARLLGNGRERCERCYGTGMEELDDGTTKPGCEHLPLSDSDKANRRLLQAMRFEELRKNMRKVGRPRPVEGPPAPKRPKGDTLKCDDPKCGREVDTYFLHFEPGDTCGGLLNRYTSDEGEPELCKGMFKKL